MQETLPAALPAGAVAGVDLGEVHIAAVTTAKRHAPVVSGRQLRSCKQWRNTVHRVLQEKLSRCQVGSRRTKRLLRRRAQLGAELYRQQRDILRQAARKVVDFCQMEAVSRLAVWGSRLAVWGCARHPDRGELGQGQQPDDQPVAAWAVRTLSHREGGVAGHGGGVDRRELFHQNVES
jgi:hypothetical protein